MNKKKYSFRKDYTTEDHYTIIELTNSLEEVNANLEIIKHETRKNNQDLNTRIDKAFERLLILSDKLERIEKIVVHNKHL